MPDSRNRRVPSTSSGRRAGLLAAVFVLAASALSATASSGPSGAAESSSASARAGSAGAPASFGTAGRAVRTGDSVPAGTDVAPQAVAVSPASAAPRTAVHTMSMDAPIQGGLTAHQEQALSARLIDSHRDAAIAPAAPYWTPAAARTAVARAESWLGMPYSWAAGNAAGPTPGRCEPGTGGDLDCHVVGFDCSGLMMYAWGAYLSLPHLADSQRSAGAFHPTLAQLLPGDLVFFSGYLSGGVGHVAIYAGDGMVIEAPQSGSVVRRSALAHLMAEDGTYRGAVRPMTTATPALQTPSAAVSTAGGTLTLRGTHLAAVDAVHLGAITVREFAQHSDSAIVFRAPAHVAGPVGVTVSTPWQAESPSVNLSYAKPRSTAPKPPASSTRPVPPTSSTAPPTSTPPSTPPSTTKPPATPPTTPPATSTPPTSTPATTTTPPTTSAPTTSTASKPGSKSGSKSESDPTSKQGDAINGPTTGS